MALPDLICRLSSSTDLPVFDPCSCGGGMVSLFSCGGSLESCRNGLFGGLGGEPLGEAAAFIAGRGDGVGFGTTGDALELGGISSLNLAILASSRGFAASALPGWGGAGQGGGPLGMGGLPGVSLILRSGSLKQFLLTRTRLKV